VRVSVSRSRDFRVVRVSSHPYSRERRPFRARQLTVLLCCSIVLSYFAARGLHTRYGLEARLKLLERSVALSQELVRLEIVRSSLDRDVLRLSAEPPDLDLLDEHARRVLGFLHPGDRRIIVAP
jgi:cell division protein FtsB